LQGFYLIFQFNFFRGQIRHFGFKFGLVFFQFGVNDSCYAGLT
jgi:hypothetical protein